MHNWNGKTLIKREVDLTIESDASRTGWGAACQRQRTGGPWTQVESQMHINCLELLAAADVRKEHNWDINTTEIGQHISCCIHKQPGGRSLPRAGSTSQEPVDVVPREEHTHHSAAPTRYSEPGSRLEVAHNTRSYGLETEPSMVQEDGAQ